MINVNANQTVLENSLARIGLTRDGRVSFIVDKASGEDIAVPGGNPVFVARKKGGVEAGVMRLDWAGDVVTVILENGESFAVSICCLDRYFAFEIVSWKAPSVEELIMGCLLVDQRADSLSAGVFGAAMTVNVDPVDFPDCLNHRTNGRVIPRFGALGARYAFAAAPFNLRKSILLDIFRAVDRERGIVSSTGGVYGRDSLINFGNYTIQFDSSMDFVRRNLPFFRSIGVDQIDFHKGPLTFRQGDFAFSHYKDASGFRDNVTSLLENNGLSAGLHTYSHYIDYTCDTLLSDRLCREQLKVAGTFTLSKSIDESATLIPVDGDTSGLCVDFGFCTVNTPYLLINDELIKFRAREPRGIVVEARGCCGTRPAAHKQGSVVKHLEGRYYGLTPVLGSDLFYDIARRTAKAFNEGGFRMIYLDALDGIASHCDPAVESSFYIASFVHEVLKNCDRDPVLEGSTYPPAMWAARGRTGAWDTPGRAYKRFNKLHADYNKAFIDRFGVPVLGWYDFYPLDERYPGNEHIKYQHTDDIDQMGSLAVAYDFPNVFNGLTPEALEKYPALKRNVLLYKQYDDLRKSGAVPGSVRERMRASKYEFRLLPSGGQNPSKKAPVFQEACYKKAKFYDVSDSERNCALFSNPFGAQQPFVRIEALLSAEDADVFTLLEGIDQCAPAAFPVKKRFDQCVDISNCLAKHVRIRGNGQKDSKIAIKLRCATDGEPGLAEYVIDTDFTGERDFLLIETDNGERSDHPFENNEETYPVYRTPFNNDRVNEISVEYEGGSAGPCLSPLTARAHKFVDISNPVLRIGNTSVTFKCMLRSTDLIEFDGKKAIVLDRFGNSREIAFESDLKAPGGSFTASLCSFDEACPDGFVRRAQLTLGFFGDIL